MNYNKYIIAGIILILFSVILFLTNTLNIIVRPITHIFLMGSSKGKDILFFGLIGIFLILSQLYKSRFIIKHLKFINIETPNKYLKIAIILAILILILGIILEIVMRYYLNIKMNTIFVSMNPTMASTSILHSHIYKSVFGTIITSLIGIFIPMGINTGSSLYQYIPNITNYIILLIPIIFITQIIAIQKRTLPITIFISFFSSCLLIGIIDGGLFSTPAIVGIIGSILVYRNEYYINYYIGKLFKNKELIRETQLHKPKYKINKELIKQKQLYKTKYKIKFIINRLVPYILLIILLSLRMSITLIGANPEYYEVDIINPTDNIDINNYSTIKIENNINETKILLYPEYNEMKLLNSLKDPLTNKCDYYTLSWNGYSYF